MLAAAGLGGELELLVKTNAEMVAVRTEGRVTRAKDRRPTWVRDLQLVGRPVVLCWWKRVWCCANELCEMKSWSEGHPAIAPARHRAASDDVRHRDLLAASHPASRPPSTVPKRPSTTSSSRTERPGVRHPLGAASAPRPALDHGPRHLRERPIHELARLGRSLHAWRPNLCVHFEHPEVNNGPTVNLNLQIKNTSQSPADTAISHATDCACCSTTAASAKVAHRHGSQPAVRKLAP